MSNGKLGARSPKNSKILAVDPGVHGAIAYVERNLQGKPVCICIQDILTRGHVYGQLLDIDRITHELNGLPIPDIVIFEEPLAVYSQPTRRTPQINTSAHTLKVSLVNFGRLQSVIEALTGIQEWRSVRPGVWKKCMGLTKSKRKSLELARLSFPVALDLLSRLGDHDRAEALLLAEYAHWHLWQPRA